MISRIINNAVTFKNRLSYINDTDVLTYDELIRKASEFANKVRDIEPEYVVLYGHKEIFMPVCIVGCLMARKTYVPIDYFIPVERIKEILNELGSYIVVGIRKLDGIEINNPSDIKLCNCKKCIDNDIAYVIFTSGSSGKPKGAQISYKNLNNFASWISNIKPLNEYKKANVLNTASFSFDLSLADLIYSLCNGHTLIATDQNDSLSYTYNQIKEKEINIIFATPTFMKLVSSDIDFCSSNLKSLYCIYFCGESLDKNLVNKILRKFEGIKIINAYGPTEATSAVSMCEITDEIINKYENLPVGVADNFATEINIEDNEIVLSGKSVFKGYLNSKKTVKKYHTGDKGVIKDNYLFCSGRIDRQIKFKGYRIEPEEIEKTINEIIDVDESVVIPIKDNNGFIFSLKALVKVSNNLDVSAIYEYLKDRLPEYMVPKIEITDDLKINDNYKMVRHD